MKYFNFDNRNELKRVYYTCISKIKAKQFFMKKYVQNEGGSVVALIRFVNK